MYAGHNFDFIRESACLDAAKIGIKRAFVNRLRCDIHHISAEKWPKIKKMLDSVFFFCLH